GSPNWARWLGKRCGFSTHALLVFGPGKAAAWSFLCVTKTLPRSITLLMRCFADGEFPQTEAVALRALSRPVNCSPCAALINGPDTAWFRWPILKATGRVHL